MKLYKHTLSGELIQNPKQLMNYIEGFVWSKVETKNGAMRDNSRFALRHQGIAAYFDLSKNEYYFGESEK